MLAIAHDLALKPARQLEAVDKHVSRIDISFARVTIANVFVAVAQVAPFAIETRPIAHVNPRHLHIANVIAAISIARVKIQHTPSQKRIVIRARGAVLMYERLRSTRVGLDAVPASGQADVQEWNRESAISVIASVEGTSKHVDSHTLPSTRELRMIALYH